MQKLEWAVEMQVYHLDVFGDDIFHDNTQAAADSESESSEEAMALALLTAATGVSESWTLSAEHLGEGGSSDSDVVVETQEPVVETHAPLGEAQQPLVDRQATEVQRQPTVRMVRQETIKNWHGFRLTWVAPRKGGRGGWQGTCPYHRKAMTVTLCKKTISVSNSGDAEAAVANALLRMKMWCISAADYSRHRDHMNAALVDPAAGEDVLEQLAESLQTQRGHLPVHRDDELDAAAAPEAATGSGETPAPKRSSRKARPESAVPA